MELDLEWTQHPDNPLISPVWPEWLLGDPVVLQSEDAPDGQWHMYLNSVLWIYHYTSPDGIKWKRRERVCHGMRAFLYEEDGEYYLFYEMNYTPAWSRLMVRRSRDLKKWGYAKVVLSVDIK